MINYREWEYRGLTCAVQQGTESEFLSFVKTPVKEYPCFNILQCESLEEAIRLTRIYADLIADIFDPINY